MTIRLRMSIRGQPPPPRVEVILGQPRRLRRENTPARAGPVDFDERRFPPTSAGAHQQPPTRGPFEAALCRKFSLRRESIGMGRFHDAPPRWECRDPENHLEPYLKLLRGWLAITKTMMSQRGMAILNHVSGDLRLVVNELGLATLTSEAKGGRCQTPFRAVLGVFVSPTAKGDGAGDPPAVVQTAEAGGVEPVLCQVENIVLRTQESGAGPWAAYSAQLSEAQQHTMGAWLSGSFDLQHVATCLRKLERPGVTRTSTVAFAGAYFADPIVYGSPAGHIQPFSAEQPWAGAGGAPSTSLEYPCVEAVVFVNHSTTVTPEDFDE
jgi:hypothetical protein